MNKTVVRKPNKNDLLNNNNDHQLQNPHLDINLIDLLPEANLLFLDETNFVHQQENSNQRPINNKLNRLNESKSSPSSNPIKIPSSKIKSQSIKSPTSQQIYSTSNESFVFVELNAPFASEESLLQSFFNGPSPTFIQQSNDSDSMNDMDELSIQLAELESAATQIDSFVESICVTNENEDLKLET